MLHCSKSITSLVCAFVLGTSGDTLKLPKQPTCLDPRASWSGGLEFIACSIVAKRLKFSTCGYWYGCCQGFIQQFLYGVSDFQILINKCKNFLSFFSKLSCEFCKTTNKLCDS